MRQPPPPYRAVAVRLAATLLWLLAFSAAAQNRIAFVNPTGQLVTVAPDGSEARVLTPPGRSYQFPAWSPVAEQVAAVGNDAEGGGVFTLYDRAGAEAKRLYGDLVARPIYLYWAPDGEKVGFLANTTGGLGLQVVGTNGGRARRLATGNPLYWQWSGDSLRLLVHSGISPAGQIAFYSAAGGAGKPLGEPGFFNAPGISASGRYLAYAESGGSATRVVLRGNRRETRRCAGRSPTRASRHSPGAP